MWTQYSVFCLCSHIAVSWFWLSVFYTPQSLLFHFSKSNFVNYLLAPTLNTISSALRKKTPEVHRNPTTNLVLCRRSHCGFIACKKKSSLTQQSGSCQCSHQPFPVVQIHSLFFCGGVISIKVKVVQHLLAPIPTWSAELSCNCLKQTKNLSAIILLKLYLALVYCN